MFGSLRFLLAVMVTAFHLAGPIELNGIKPFSYTGQYAVFSFYLISGYLMTLILNERYQFHFSRFWANRFVRLYPGYLVTGAITCVVLWVWPSEAAAFHDSYRGPIGPIDYLGNATVFLLPFYEANFRVIPPAWSIGVELVMYFLLFVLVARKVEIATVSLLAAGCYFIMAAVPTLGWDRYYSIPAAALPFSLGSMIYFVRCWHGAVLPCSVTLLLGSLVIAWIAILAASAFGADYQLLFHLNLVVMAGIVLCLSTARTDLGWLRALDKFLGDLAYPVFLLHWLVGLLVVITTQSREHRGMAVLLYSLPFVMLAATLMVLLVDRPLAKVRDKIRPSEPKK